MIKNKKEFFDLRYVAPKGDPDSHPVLAYNDYNYLNIPEASGLQLQGHQLFIRNIFNPHTPFRRLLLYHATGTGKSLVIHSIAKMYIDYFKNMRQNPQVTILGFTEEILVKELMKFPEFGYVTKSELAEYKNLIEITKTKARGDRHDKNVLRRRSLKAIIKRRIVDRERGGYYKFYGYQKFANDLIQITPKGLEENVNHNYIYESDKTFESKLEEGIKNGTLKLNRQLIESLRYSFMACDEIHNVYNAKQKNNRGIAIEYVLKVLQREDPTSAPRVIYTSATPLTGSPTEIVDVINLLIPTTGESHKRSEFFDKKDELKHGALERIAKLCDGYVSFLRDTNNIQDYPERILKGVSIPDIKYVKFTKCVMSKLLIDTIAEVKKLETDEDEIESLIVNGTYTLYDIAFPNPDSNKIGLYQSTKIVSTISTASDSWKRSIGIDANIKTGVITGSFLELGNIGKYSTKYEILVEEMIDLLDNKKTGKVLIYHHYVNTSGILTIKELFLQNGFIDATSTALSNTRCVICGVINKKHDNITDHNYLPARVVTAYGEDPDKDVNLLRYNSKENRFGELYKIMIGSRYIIEGIDFNSIRFLYALSLPKDYPNLIQLYGRAVRRGSHLLLPPEYRNVEVHTLISVYPESKRTSLEILLYRRKSAIFEQIQLIERELRIYSIDNFVNYERLVRSHQASSTEATIDGLPYVPAPKTILSKSEKEAIPHILKRVNNEITTFSAYKYAIEEVNTLIRTIKKLFLYQSIWKYGDLWESIRHPTSVIKTPFDHSMFSEHNYALALDFLVNGTYLELHVYQGINTDTDIPYLYLGNEFRRIVHNDPYFILVPIDNLGIPIVEYDSFMRTGETESVITISTNEFMRDTQNCLQFDNNLEIFKDKYINKPLQSLVYLLPNFHYSIARLYVEGLSKKYPKLIEIYEEVRFLVYVDDFKTKEIASSYGFSKNIPVGYYHKDYVDAYVNKEWVKIPRALFNEKNYENFEVIGFTQVQKTGVITFKIRIDDEEEDVKDARKIRKGINCESLVKSERIRIAKLFGLDIIKSRSNSNCQDIMMSMMNREVKERKKNRNIIRYFNFFFD